MYDQETPSLSPASRRAVIEPFWGDIRTTDARGNVSENDAYFEYFETQCRLVHQLAHPVYRVCTQGNIHEVVRQLKAGADRETIKADLHTKTKRPSENNDTSLNQIIELAVRLWLMVHTGDVQRGVTGQTALFWREGCLKDGVAAHFQHQRILTDMVKFEKLFHARNIERIAGLIEDGKKPVLNIFHHAAFLNYHRNVDFFPVGLVDETIRTLALLLATHDQDSRKWLRKQQSKLRLDPAAMKCGQLKLEERQIDHSNFWHDRLVVLKQFFDDSSPRPVKQWWFDDRKRVQWFWVAILLVICTLLFGLVQCIEGGWQIWKAYHP